MDNPQLWTRFKQHSDTAAREALILRYACLVRAVAERLGVGTLPSRDRDDLICHGIAGLVDAVEEYEPGSGAPFEAYANTRIANAIREAARSLTSLPKAPAARPARPGAARGTHVLQGAALWELGAAVGLRESACAPVGGGAPPVTRRAGSAGDPGTDEARKTAARQSSRRGPAGAAHGGNGRAQSQRKVLVQAIGDLPPDERLALFLYYCEELTLKEIGQVMHLTEPRVAQIHTRAMIRLRARLRTQAELSAAA